MKKTLKGSSDYIGVALSRLSKKNKLSRITKGKYTKISNPFVIATNLFTPSYLSYWSCSYFKGYTEQIVNTIQVVTTLRHKNIDFEGYVFEFYNTSKKNFFGYEKIKAGNEFVFAADNEKLIIDSLLKEDLLGNFDEIIKIVLNAEINPDKIAEYLNKINNKSLNKRAGFLLEKYKKIDLSEKISFYDNNYVRLSKLKCCKEINKKWRIKV